MEGWQEVAEAKKRVVISWRKLSRSMESDGGGPVSEERLAAMRKAQARLDHALAEAGPYTGDGLGEWAEHVGTFHDAVHGAVQAALEGRRDEYAAHRASGKRAGSELDRLLAPRTSMRAPAGELDAECAALLEEAFAATGSLVHELIPLVDSVRAYNGELFAASSKAFGTALSYLFDLAQELQLPAQATELRSCTLSVIGAARLCLKHEGSREHMEDLEHSGQRLLDAAKAVLVAVLDSVGAQRELPDFRMAALREVQAALSASVSSEMAQSYRTRGSERRKSLSLQQQSGLGSERRMRGRSINLEKGAQVRRQSTAVAQSLTAIASAMEVERLRDTKLRDASLALLRVVASHVPEFRPTLDALTAEATARLVADIKQTLEYALNAVSRVDEAQHEALVARQLSALGGAGGGGSEGGSVDSLQLASDSATGSASQALRAREQLRKYEALEAYDRWRTSARTHRKNSIGSSGGINATGSSGILGKLKDLCGEVGDGLMELLVQVNQDVLQDGGHGDAHAVASAARMVHATLTKALGMADAVAGQNDVDALPRRLVAAAMEQMAHAADEGRLVPWYAEMAAANPYSARLVRSSLRVNTYRYSRMLRNVALQTVGVLAYVAANPKSAGAYGCLAATCARLQTTLDDLLTATANLKALLYGRSNRSTNPHSSSTSPLESGAGDEALTTALVKLMSQRNTMWEEYEQDTRIVRDKAGVLEASSFGRLVLYVLLEADNGFTEAVLHTYGSYTTPYELLDRLTRAFSECEGHVAGKSVAALRGRVVVVLKKWLQYRAVDFDEYMVDELQAFVSRTVARTEGFASLAGSLQDVIASSVGAPSEKSELKYFLPDDGLRSSRENGLALFAGASEQEFAEQLTLAEYRIYQSIEAAEFMNQAWSKEKLQHRSPNVVQLITNANRVSFWVASMILWVDKGKERRKIVEKFVAVAEALRKLNNFNSLMGILAGLNAASIQRLKAFKSSDLSKKSLAALKKIEDLMSPSNSYKLYRETLSGSALPCLPYIGLFLSDLTFIDDGNPDYVNDGLINVVKYVLTYREILKVKQYQAVPYTFSETNLYPFIEVLASHSDKDLYDFSLYREPRDK